MIDQVWYLALWGHRGTVGARKTANLLEEVVVAFITGLDAARGVHGPGARRPRVVHETRVEGLAVHLLGERVRERAAAELVAADVADLEGGVLVGEGEVREVGRRRGVCPLRLLKSMIPSNRETYSINMQLPLFRGCLH